MRPAAGPPEPRTRRLPGVEPAPATRSAEVAAEPASPPPKESDEAAPPGEPRSPRAVGGRPRPAPEADAAEPSSRAELAPEAPAAPHRAEAAQSFPAAAVSQTIAGEPPRAPAVPVSTPTTAPRPSRSTRHRRRPGTSPLRTSRSRFYRLPRSACRKTRTRQPIAARMGRRSDPPKRWRIRCPAASPSPTLRRPGSTATHAARPVRSSTSRSVGSRSEP